VNTPVSTVLKSTSQSNTCKITGTATLSSSKTWGCVSQYKHTKNTTFHPCGFSNVFVLQVVKRKYQQEYDIAPPITFAGDYVALDIPDDGTQTDSG